MPGKHWIKEPLRIIALQNEGSVYNPALLDDFDTTLDYWKKNGFNVEQCKHLVGRLYDPEKHHDVLKEYAEKAENLDIKIILYYNVHVITQKIARQHPDWKAVDKLGNPFYRYEIDFGVCINSPWRNAVMDGLESLKDVPIRGIFLDGPVYWDEGCYCPVCRKHFKETFGIDMENSGSQQRREFGVQSVVRFLKDFRERYLAVYPDGMVYMNNRGLTPSANGRDIYRAKPYLDMLGTEGGFMFYGPPDETPLWKTGAAAKYLEGVDQDMPRVIFCAADHKPWSFYLHTESETSLMYASANANGASVWYGFHSPLIFEGMNYFHTPGGKEAAAFSTFLADNTEYYRNTRSGASIALMWSQNSADHYGGAQEETDFTEEEARGKEDVRGNHSRSFHGFYEMLFRSGLCFDIITEETVREGIPERYQTIILPNCACLSDEAAGMLGQWTEAGGTIIATAESSLYEPSGSRRKDYALSDLLGISWNGSFTDYPAGVSFFDVDSETHTSILTELSQTKMLPMAGYAPDFVPEGSTRTLAYWREPMEGRYAPPTGRSVPAAVIRNTGSGRAVYFSGNIGEAFGIYGIPDYRILFSELIKSYSPQPVITNAPSETVETVLRYQPDHKRHLLHLINFTGSMRRPVTGIIPMRDIRISLRITSAESVTALKTGKNLPLEKKGDQSVCILPRLDDYEVLIIR